MAHVINLSSGWAVTRDAATGRPWFKRRGREITPYDLSGLPEARTVFRELKREVDKRDMARVGLDDRDFYALDMAKYALQISLEQRHRWSSDLLENEVMNG